MTDPVLDSEQLAKVSRLFEALDSEARHSLLAASAKKSFAAAEVICREGEPGDEFYVIAKGQVRVSADDLGTEKEVAVLGPGTFFGEMGALSGMPRSATITALTDVELVAFPFAAVRAVLKNHPRAREVLTKVGVQRTEETMQKLME